MLYRNEGGRQGGSAGMDVRGTRLLRRPDRRRMIGEEETRTRQRTKCKWDLNVVAKEVTIWWGKVQRMSVDVQLLLCILRTAGAARGD